MLLQRNNMRSTFMLEWFFILIVVLVTYTYTSHKMIQNYMHTLYQCIIPGFDTGLYVRCIQLGKNTLENPRDGGAWWAAVYGVAQSRTRLKGLSSSSGRLAVKNPPANAGDMKVMGSIPGPGRSPGGGHGNPCQYPCLETYMDRGTWGL